MRILKGNEWRYLMSADGKFQFESLRDTFHQPEMIMTSQCKFIIHDSEGNDYVLYLDGGMTCNNIPVYQVTLSHSTRRRIEAGEIPPINCHPIELLRANRIPEKKCSDGHSENRRQHAIT